MMAFRAVLTAIVLVLASAFASAQTEERAAVRVGCGPCCPRRSHHVCSCAHFVRIDAAGLEDVAGAVRIRMARAESTIHHQRARQRRTPRV